jgi:hydrogenase maturation protease
MPSLDLLILGLGNVLYGDDGLGVVAAHLIERQYEIPDAVQVLDGGTLGLSLLPLVGRARRVIIIDAIRNPGVEPGGLVRLDGGDVPPALRNRLSAHQIGVSDLLSGAALLDCMPAELVLVGVVPESLDFEVRLSRTVERRMPALVGNVVREAAAMGHRLAAKQFPEARSAAETHYDVPAIVFRCAATPGPAPAASR